MKELKNLVTVTGKLVKNNIEEFKTKKGVDAIGGSLVLRTADNSEHEINFYANKYKKNENKEFTTEENYFYKQYMDAKNNLKDIEHCSEGESPDIVSITDGKFTDNDFKINGKVVSSNKINAKFINKIEPKDYESTVLEAKFEVEGIVEKITDEIVKDVPTGNLVVTMNAIGQMADGFGNTGTYDLCELRVRTVMDNWFCGVDKKDKRAYLISFNEIDENVFEDRKIALKRIHNAEQKYPQVSGETYYEEY